jgi:hypothetical protein
MDFWKFKIHPLNPPSKNSNRESSLQTHNLTLL